MKLRPWHLAAALLASVSLHFGAVALTVDTSEEPALLEGGGGGSVSMLGEAYTDMLTAGDPDTANAVAAESPDTLAPVDPDAAEPETQEQITAQEVPVQEASETPVQEPLQQMAEVQPQEAAPVEELAIQPLTNAEAIVPLNETPDETVTAIEPVPVPDVRPKDLATKVAEAKPEQPVKKTQKKKPEAQRQPSTQKGNSKANAVQGAGGAANQVASQGSSENQGRSTILGNSNRTNYKGQVQRALQRAMRRVRSRASGLATVSFVVSKDGSVSGIRISGSSGNPEVDEVALELVRRAAPFPPIPAEEGRSTWNFNVPVEITRR
ncbi:TonB family protein [Pannonibacter phragmitetus]|uniref:energy transducer TonB family protein n=1 Tax=Pannonibacter phragmitetus TaxID=121719 RepID=UPI003D2F0B21